MISRLDEILYEYDNQDKFLKSKMQTIVRYGIMGSLGVSLSLLSLRCDMNEQYRELKTNIGETNSELELIESKIPRIGVPCYYPIRENVYEVRPC